MKKFILLLMLAFSLSLVTAQVLFDGFETGNTQGSTTINGWTQATGPTYTTKFWTANSTQTNYNRTPRTGSWNVTLQYSGEAWLFRPVSLTAATSYTIELYARQDGATSANANIGIYYGTAATIAAMSNTILPQTGMVNGNYQKFSGSFTPDATQTYYIGIKGYINGSPWYISLDDITLGLTPNDPEPTNHVTDFAAGTIGYTSIPLTWTGSTGAQLPAGYLIQAIKVGTGSYVSVTDTNPVANDSDWSNGNAAINVAHVAGANTYTFTGLTHTTAYEFKIWPYSNSGALINFKVDAPIPTVNASTLNPTQPLPYPQNFNGGTTLAGINWTGDMFIGTGHGTTSNVLYRNLHSYTPTTNAVSCPIGPMVANAELMFDYRYVDYYSPYPGITLGTGDKLEIQISTNDGASFTTVHTINQSNHVVSNAFAPVIVELDAYPTGNIKVKFLGTWGAGDYWLDIDNVVVRETPSTAVFTLDPDVTEWNYQDVQIGQTATKTFRVTNSGAADLTFSSVGVSGTGFTPDPAFDTSAIVPLGYRDFTVKFSPTAEQAYTGELTFNFTRETVSVDLLGEGIPYGVSTATSTADDDIGQIILGSFANPATAPTPLTNNPASDQMYNDYTALGPIDIQKTVATPLTLTQINSGSYYTCHFKVFIDYNQNLAFELPDELALTGSTSPSYGGSNPYNGFITVPVSATEGTTRMRIVLQETINPDLVLPVGTYSWGETEDYTVNITAAPAILTPSNLSATNIDGDSAELSWTENNTPAAELWDIKYGAPGFDPATEGTPVSGVSTNPYTLTGLDPSTSYHWYVRSITSPVRDVSAWAGPGSFNTQQIPATLPFAEDWESGQDGWTFVNGAQTNAWYVGAGDATYTPYEGTSFAYISNNSGTNVAYTNTATSVTHIYRDIAFDAASVEFPLSFMWKCVGETTAWDKMRVYVVDTSVTPVAGTALTTGQVGLANYNGQANWTAATITLPSTLSGTTKRVVFSWSNDSSGGTNPPINLDYINLTAVPVTSAPNPAVLVSPLDDALNVPLTQTLNWTSGGGYVEGYRLSFGTVTPYAVIVNDLDLDMVTTYDPTLAYGTEYWWTVTPYNYLGDATPVTQWTFTTAADPTVIIPPDYLQNFETWPGTGWTQMNYLYGGTPATGGSWLQDDWLNVTSPVDKAAKINIYSTTHNSWLITPPIQVPGGDYVLEFDLALMHWSTQSTPVIAGEQADDRLLLVMSDNADMSSPTTLMEWNNTGSSNVFDNISPTGETISYPLAGITGTKHFAWYAESITDTAGDNDLMVNNVMIRIPPTAPEAPLLVYPGTDATDLPKTGFDLSWQNNPLGLEPDYFVVYMWTDAQGEFGGPFWETADASVTTLNPTVVIPEGETEPLTFAYDDRWNWTVSAVLGTTEVIADSRWFVIQSDPTITIPHTQSFGTDATPVWPSGWTQSYQDGVTSNRWTASATANAGGTANEMMCTWASGTGISRLITPPINTDGIANFSAQFNHYYNDYAVGATAKVQYSHDLATWYDTNWTLASGGGDDLGQRTALVLGINQPITYVAWVMDGNHFQFDNWYVDDVVLDLMPEHDVAPVSIGGFLGEVADAATPIYPTAQVANLGVNVETFTVTATWDTYTDTQTVTDLGIGQTATVTFAPFTPNTYAAAYFTVTTNLSTDVNTVNDVLQTPLVTLPLDRPALASNLWTDYLVGFNLKDPGTLTDLIDKSAYQSLYAGDWMNGKWYACEDYDDVNLVGGNFWQIDPPAGTMTDLGDGTTSMHGLAWDDVNGVLYGHDAANLYTLNPATGAILTTVGPHGITYQSGETTYEGLVISIAYDNYTQTLYAVELRTASLYTLNVTTGAATKVGAAEDWLGIDVNYAQDMAFDQDTGLLYLAGYTNSTQGALYWIDTTYGYAWKVGPFQGSSEMDAFAIPYGDAFVGTPDVTIAADGTLSWPAINGAAGYYVYAADDPYGTYTKIATVYDLSWLDPNFPETMKFYQVVAFGGRAASNNQADVNINPSLRKTGTRAAGEVTASPADRNQRQLKK